ncbi:hypothetical protein HanIR_Chr10g0487971 [Helianthus annuus]|nr:hypothetical protein HanIR_Chr10g0487971 [Helianthus annuus]
MHEKFIVSISLPLEDHIHIAQKLVTLHLFINFLSFTFTFTFTLCITNRSICSLSWWLIFISFALNMTCCIF